MAVIPEPRPYSLLVEGWRGQQLPHGTNRISGWHGTTTLTADIGDYPPESVKTGGVVSIVEHIEQGFTGHLYGVIGEGSIESQEGEPPTGAEFFVSEILTQERGKGFS
jgi:hypothetical protein